MNRRLRGGFAGAGYGLIVILPFAECAVGHCVDRENLFSVLVLLRMIFAMRKTPARKVLKKRCVMEKILPRAIASRFSALIGRISRHPRLVLIFFCLALWAPGVVLLPPLDRDESRFAQSSKQMLESKDFVDIRFGTAPRYKKPVGIYWLQSATTAAVDAVTGVKVHNRIWTYRLASLIGAVTAVLLTYRLAAYVAGTEAAFLAGLLASMLLLLAGEATLATTDAVLLACILGAQDYFLRVYRSAREGLAAPGGGAWLVGWGCLGLGVLVKGPMALPIAGLTLLALSLWDRNANWIKKTKPMAGLLLVLLIVLPWAAAIGLRSHGGFYDQSLGHDFAAKLASGQESHGASAGYYLALLPITFWPGTLFLLQGLGVAVRRRAEPSIRFLICWIVPAWLMFELVPTKLPHYVLPLYPALAVLAAIWMTGIKRADRKSAEAPVEALAYRVLAYASPVLYAAAAAAFVAAAILLPGRFGYGAPSWLIADVAFFSLFCLLALVAYGRRLMLTTVLCAMASVLAFYPALTAGLAPSLEPLWVSPRLTAAVKAVSQPGDPPPALAGYIEPSSVFLLGSDVRLTSGAGAADAGASQGGLALIEDRHRADFLRGLAEREADAKEVGAVAGFNYSRGKPVHIRLYRVVPVRDWAPEPPQE